MSIINSDQNDPKTGNEVPSQSAGDDQGTYRILVIDDNEAIHSDFEKILSLEDTDSNSFTDAKAAFLGVCEEKTNELLNSSYLLDSAFQGKQALELVIKSLEEKQPYALAFVDMRMPPGWDGLETVQRIWEVDPDLQVVFCTAYSDHSWEEMNQQIGNSDKFLILKKPFDHLEVKQLAFSLTSRWDISQQDKQKINQLKKLTSNEIEESKAPVVRHIQDTISDAHSKTSHTHIAPVVDHSIAEIVQQLKIPIQFLNDHLNSTMEIIPELEKMFSAFPPSKTEGEGRDPHSSLQNNENEIDPELIKCNLTYSTQGSLLGLQKVQELIEKLQCLSGSKDKKLSPKMNLASNS